MSDNRLIDKEAYFHDQDLLDILDDDFEMSESSKVIEQALEEELLPSSCRIKNIGNFLGPTPKELLANFEAHTTRQRAFARHSVRGLARSITAPTSDVSSNLTSHTINRRSNQKKTVSSLPTTPTKAQIPFYQRLGDIPRELKQGKNAKLATKIKLLPLHKQLFKGKIIYFYPNNDTSMVQRMRIHKVIELGAAWVKSWRNDVTHIILDDDCHTYTQLLKHLDMDSLPENIILIKFEPYVPQCMQLGRLLDPFSHRFTIRDGPMRKDGMEATKTRQAVGLPQTSITLKRPMRQNIAQETVKANSHLAGMDLVSKQPTVEMNTNAFDKQIQGTINTESYNPSDHRTGNCFDDDLLLAIQEAKAVAHLPLDEDEDGRSPTMSIMGDEEGPNPEKGPPGMALSYPKKRSIISKASELRNKDVWNPSAFQCMNPSTSSSIDPNPNARTIEILEDMCKYYNQMQDQWRALAYRKVIATLKQQTVKITTAKQASTLPHIGPRLAGKIEEIILTDRLQTLDNTRNDPLATSLRLFLGVYGAGLAQAHKWIQAGYRTLDDLQTAQAQAQLTNGQKVGVHHYTHFNTRIPRAEVEAHAAVVQAALRQLAPTYEATLMGSYRRGAAHSGDIDLLITCAATPLPTMRSLVFDTLVPHLFATGFLKACLATSSSSSSSSSSSATSHRCGSKWHGASCLPSSTIWRRIDFLLAPEPELGAALLYFTGSDVFNRSMRLLARKKRMRLNQRGLYQDEEEEKEKEKGDGGGGGGGATRRRRGERRKEGEGHGVLLEARCEKRIFEILGVPWREPQERNC